MRAQESFVYSLLTTAAVALPATSGEPKPAACPAKKSVDTSDKHVADLRQQVASLRKEIQSVYDSPTQACRAKPQGTAYGTVAPGFTGAFTAAMSTGAASATMPAAYESFFKSAGPVSRLTPTSVRSYGASSGAPAPTGVGKDDGSDDSEEGSEKGSGSDNSSSGSGSGSGSSDASSKASSEAPFPTMSGHSNGTSLAATGMPSSSSLFSTGVPTASSSGLSSSSSVASSSTSSGVSPTYVPSLKDFTDAEIQSGDAWKNVSSIADDRMKARDLNGTCTYENAAVRTEFRAMSKEQRKAFTDAVICLQNMPPQVMTADQSSKYAGVKTRYDEYVATHIENTLNIHATADFLAWHRHFIWSFEQDLQNSCGYTGTLPYWDWAADAQALHESEVFNGDEYSMGSNGEYIAGREDTYLGLQDLNFPPGTGGGCVYSGPFSNTSYTTNLGPIDSPYNNNVEGHFDYNPRCLVRDLNSWFSSRYNTYTNVADLVLGEDSVQYFQALMQGYLGDNKLGVHGGGHWLGGGPSQLEDFHSSPSDPVFYIHHAMIDRIWTVWQYMDREARQDAIYGTSTLNNSPASPDMTLQDKLPFGLVTENPVFGDLMDTLSGKYCYRYE